MKISLIELSIFILLNLICLIYYNKYDINYIYILLINFLIIGIYYFNKNIKKKLKIKKQNDLLQMMIDYSDITNRYKTGNVNQNDAKRITEIAEKFKEIKNNLKNSLKNKKIE